jgi:hypothetical protein
LDVKGKGSEEASKGCIDPIGLGESPRGPGEVAHLTGIDHYYRQSCHGQSSNHRPLEATGGFHYH